MKRENQRGVTLIALVTTIVVLLILASIATYSGVQVIESSKLTTFTTEMKIMQINVNELYDKWKRGELATDSEGNIDIGKDLAYNQEVKEQTNKVLKTELDITDTTGYKYFDKETISNLKIEGVKQEFFINIKKRDVVSYKGLKYNNNMYYTLTQLPQGLYNVEYKPNQSEKPIFDVNYKNVGENKWKITVSNIQYDGYINKWTVKYKLEDKDYWSTSENLSFEVNSAGIYKIKIENGEVQSDEKIIEIKNEENEIIEGAIIPKGFYYVGGKKGSGVVISDDSADKDKYKGQDIVGTDIQGNQFVWIPVENSEEFVTYEGYSGGKLENEKKYCQEPSENGYINEKEEYEKMKKSVLEHKGFYVARYEMSKDENDSSRPASKQGKEVWNNISWGNSYSEIGTYGAVKNHKICIIIEGFME